jgi:hypothetical protein
MAASVSSTKSTSTSSEYASLTLANAGAPILEQLPRMGLRGRMFRFLADPFLI